MRYRSISIGRHRIRDLFGSRVVNERKNFPCCCRPSGGRYRWWAQTRIGVHLPRFDHPKNSHDMPTRNAAALGAAGFACFSLPALQFERRRMPKSRRRGKDQSPHGHLLLAFGLILILAHHAGRSRATMRGLFGSGWPPTGR